MIVTNQTTSDLYFGPLHLAAGIGVQLVVDDTSATSLYLTNDSVADALNNAYNSGKVTVTGAADPFPRPTGDPQVLHGSGNPEGLVFAPQGTIYLRRDGVQTNGGVVYMKETGVTLSTGWVDIATASGATALLPAGTIALFGGATAPTGWLVCDGSAISRSVYSVLFAAISTLYGSGDGSTTFNLPDLRGRVPVGYAASGGHVDVSVLGNSDGIVESHRRPKHRHTPHVHNLAHVTSTQLPGNIDQGWFVNADNNSPTSYSTGYIASADGGTGNSNDAIDAPAYLVVNHIIKT